MHVVEPGLASEQHSAPSVGLLRIERHRLVIGCHLGMPWRKLADVECAASRDYLHRLIEATFRGRWVYRQHKILLTPIVSRRVQLALIEDVVVLPSAQIQLTLAPACDVQKPASLLDLV